MSCLGLLRTCHVYISDKIMSHSSVSLVKVDVYLEVGQEKIGTNKALLARHSDYFRFSITISRPLAPSTYSSTGQCSSTSSARVSSLVLTCKASTPR